jgi:hypothetical protein
LIFSTWEDQELEFIEGEKVVLSKDPGSGLRYQNVTASNNINRQIVSTFAGLRQVRTPYVVKMRSDLLVTNSRLGSILRKIPATPNNELSTFKNYVIVPDRLTFSPRKKTNPALHVTDMLQAGVTSDVLSLWDIPRMTYEEEFYYLEVKPKLLDSVRKHIPEFRAEQYFWNKHLCKQKGLKLSTTFSSHIGEGIETEAIFSSNIIPFRFPTIGVEIQKEGYDWSSRDSWISSIYAYTYSDWKRDVRKLGIKIDLPIGFLFWELRGQFYGFVYRRGLNLAPYSKLQRFR